MPTQDFGGPNDISAGPDGNLWFTQTTWRTEPGQGPVASGGAIGRITPRGRITEYPLPKATSSPGGIAAGPDGNMWFTEPNANRIGWITPAGVITEYPLPKAGSTPSGITAGPDVNMWFTEMNGERIGRISPTATPTAVKYPCPINVTLHKPTPTTVGSRILTDTITTNNSSCHLLKPVVLCRPLASTTAGEKAFCDTKITPRGEIRVNTKGYQATRVTVIVRASQSPATQTSGSRTPGAIRGSCGSRLLPRTRMRPTSP